jgi:ribosomal protein L11 methyltransferase
LKWLEVSLSVNSELSEAIADLLARYAPGGVSLEATQIEDDTAEGHPVGPIVVRAFLPADEQLQAQQRRLEEGLWHLGQIQPLPEPSYRLLEEEDWAHAWKTHYQPIPIGRRLILIPSWSQIPASDRLPVILDPGMAFGTGLHPTTRLCLTTIEDYLQPGQRVVDLGCGSGILSIAAARLGASHVLALDIDQNAVQVARSNVHRNGLTKTIQIEIGSLPELLAAGSEINPPAQLLLANILEPVLEKMIGNGLEQAVEAGGHLILSGILDQQVESLLNACEQSNLELIETRAEDDWHALIFEVSHTDLLKKTPS